MAGSQKGRRRIDPARNPAVWDTLTWEAPRFIQNVLSQSQGFWAKTHGAVCSGRPSPASPTLVVHDGSAACRAGRCLVLIECEDGQHGLVEFVKGGASRAGGECLAQSALSDGTTARFYEVTSGNLQRAYAVVAPSRLPQALRMVPRLGIGTRMSKAVWPGIWQAMNECLFSANAIQNSMRELNLLENIGDERVDRELYYPGIGFVPEGHTGSTFEGLCLCGVTESLKAGCARPYGADADHIMVKRGSDGLEHAKKIIQAARSYSFYTIDVSDILDYAALRGGTGLVGKYRQAMDALEALAPFIASLKEGEVFDLELSIDEHPPEIDPFDCLTSETEAAFILDECKQRGIPLTHLAPNLGVEKHVDYRYRDGRAGLEARTRSLHRLASEHGVLLDCHSGDDLSSETRQTLKRATGGLLNFKISPSLQTLFAEVLYDFDTSLFNEWWDDTRRFALENARRGSDLAARCIRRYESEPGARPGPEHDLFRLFCYATIGKRDPTGIFLYRERFYSLSPSFYGEYTRRVSSYLCSLAGDLLWRE